MFLFEHVKVVVRTLLDVLGYVRPAKCSRCVSGALPRNFGRIAPKLCQDVQRRSLGLCGLL